MKMIKIYKRCRMNIHLDYSFSISEFLEMVESVGWKTYSKSQVEKALKNSESNC